MSRGRRVGAVVLVVAAALVLGSCQVARPGTRCRTAGAWGQDSTHILRCQNRRWARVMTKADYARILIAAEQKKDAEEAAARAAATPPAPTPPPIAQDVFQAIYVVPAGKTSDPAMPAAIRHELELVAQWYRIQTGGRAPRFERDAAGAIQVWTVGIPATEADLTSAGNGRYGLIAAQLEAQGFALGSPSIAAGAPAVAFVEFDPFPTCGQGSDGFAVVYEGQCGRTNVGAPSQLVYGDTLIAIAHELAHALGAVRSCAPHSDPAHPGHIDDVGDDRDILYYSPDPSWYLEMFLLDPGRDDYYGHGRDDCTDIARSPWWE